MIWLLATKCTATFSPGTRCGIDSLIQFIASNERELQWSFTVIFASLPSFKHCFFCGSHVCFSLPVQPCPGILPNVLFVLIPFPWWPLLQEHVWDPIVFVHSPPSFSDTQLSDVMLHSFTSDEQEHFLSHLNLFSCFSKLKAGPPWFEFLVIFDFFCTMV